jgi:hypothetical protein
MPEKPNLILLYVLKKGCGNRAPRMIRIKTIKDIHLKMFIICFN